MVSDGGTRPYRVHYRDPSFTNLQAVAATVDGRTASVHFDDGKLTFRADPGRHKVTVTASDYQELKNMEDVAKIKPNTATLTRTVTVR